jgi:far upstream element-binding protein
VGLIIGRSGENLRRVENTTGARVQFMDGPEVPGPQRHCRISGSRAARAAAKTEIFRIIDDNEVSKRGGPPPDRSRRQDKVTTTKEGDSLQMMVPDRTVGLIIGRGGETIRDLQDRSGCHVNIVGENKSINGLRPVNLIGSASAQQYARDLILEIVESDQKGISVKDLHRDREDSHGLGGGGGGGGGGSKINDSIIVPGDAVGMIIGKGMMRITHMVRRMLITGTGGESIKDMQNQTGCKINVSPASGRDIEREIGLIGTRHAIEAAKRAIMEKVDVVVSLIADVVMLCSN